MEKFIREVIEHAEYVLSQTPEMLPVLKQAGVVPQLAKGAKVILSGELTRKVSLKGIAATKGAKAAIEAAGGSLA